MPLLAVILFIGAIVVFLVSLAQQEHLLVFQAGNSEQKALPLEVNRYQCPECKMPIETLKFSAQAALPNGKTFFFDDVGCLVLWVEDKEEVSRMKLWVHTLDTARWIAAQKAYYSRTEQTPMLYGFGAYEKNKEGLIGYETMRLMMLRGENLNDPYLRKKLLGE